MAPLGNALVCNVGGEARREFRARVKPPVEVRSVDDSSAAATPEQEHSYGTTRRETDARLGTRATHRLLPYQLCSGVTVTMFGLCGTLVEDRFAQT